VMASPLLFQEGRSDSGADRGLAGAWCSSGAPQTTYRGRSNWT
jgi:hypothetical protein